MVITAINEIVNDMHIVRMNMNATIYTATSKQFVEYWIKSPNSREYKI